MCPERPRDCAGESRSPTTGLCPHYVADRCGIVGGQSECQLFRYVIADSELLIDPEQNIVCHPK